MSDDQVRLWCCSLKLTVYIKGLNGIRYFYILCLRTQEILWAVSWGDFSQSARRNLVVDFPLRQHASTCSSCPITARRAFYAISWDMPSAWTQALSSPNSAAQTICTGGLLQVAWITKVAKLTVVYARSHQNKGESWWISSSPFVSLNWMSADLLQSAPSH